MRGFWIVAMLGLFFGCGGKEDRPGQVTGPGAGGRAGPVTNTGGRASGGGGGSSGGSAGAGADTSMAGNGGEGGDDAGALAPVVEITNPEAVSDPDAGPVLLQDMVEVRCTVTKSSASGAANVDPSTVKIAMLDATGKVLKEVGGASAANPNEYAASFVLTTLGNGVVRFRCKANDIGASPRTGSTEISTFVDHGPKITVVSPTAVDILPLKSAVAFEFAVDPWALADGDVGSAVGDLSLTVLDVPIEDLAPAPNRPGFYIATVDFTDPVLFPETPSGDIPVVITAENQRKPASAVRSEAYLFKLDGAGPVIKILYPESEAIVGPKTRQLRFTVSDTPSGVDLDTVTVSLNGVEFRYQPSSPVWTESKGTFTFTFEKTKIEGSIAQATINIHAEDRVGNRGDGESRTIYLDDHPPIVSFNPGNVRIVTSSGSPTAKDKCSISFDPLGPAAANDLDTVPPAALFRLLVWDETNYAPGQKIIYYSGTDQATVFMYLQPDPTQPLLVDTNNNGACDTVLTKDKAGKDLVLLHMEPVGPQGNVPNFTNPPSPNDFTTVEPIVAADFCDLSTAVSNPLCSGKTSDMTYVLKHTAYGRADPVVYAVEPKPSSLACAGATWEVPVLHTGWVCLAAVAYDFAQNGAISAPLRVCVDDDADPLTLPCDGVPPPSCTDGCTPPPEFPSSVIRYAP